MRLYRKASKAPTIRFDATASWESIQLHVRNQLEPPVSEDSLSIVLRVRHALIKPRG